MESPALIIETAHAASSFFSTPLKIPQGVATSISRKYYVKNIPINRQYILYTYYIRTVYTYYIAYAIGPMDHGLHCANTCITTFFGQKTKPLFSYQFHKSLTGYQNSSANQIIRSLSHDQPNTKNQVHGKSNTTNKVHDFRNRPKRVERKFFCVRFICPNF